MRLRRKKEERSGRIQGRKNEERTGKWEDEMKTIGKEEGSNKVIKGEDMRLKKR